MKHHKDIKHLNSMKLNDKDKTIATDDGTLVEFNDDYVKISTDKETAHFSLDKFWDYVVNVLDSFWSFKKKDIEELRKR